MLATAVATVTGGTVKSITVTNPGAGYDSAPTVTISGNGTGAAATVSLTDMQSFGTPTFTPPAQVGRVRSFATEVAAATNASSSAVLTWENLRPGTYLIQSGTQPSIQHPMGLYGVLVVTDANYPGTFNGVTYTFDKDVVLLLSEIDPVQNIAVDTAVKTAGFSDTAVVEWPDSVIAVIRRFTPVIHRQSTTARCTTWSTASLSTARTLPLRRSRSWTPRQPR